MKPRTWKENAHGRRICGQIWAFCAVSPPDLALRVLLDQGYISVKASACRKTR
jgi:hypothetical protein